jgi:hypothetical protein
MGKKKQKKNQKENLNQLILKFFFQKKKKKKKKKKSIQNEAITVPTAQKIELIGRLVRCGLPTVEAGSFVSPKWVPQVRLNVLFYLFIYC